jgi:hypothetical protein
MYGVWAGFFTRVKCTVNGQTFVVRGAALQTFTQKTPSLKLACTMVFLYSGT